MDLAELAHWEYRRGMLTAILASRERAMALAKKHRSDTAISISYITGLHNEIDCLRWLLAETQYKITLGRLEREYGS